MAQTIKRSQTTSPEPSNFTNIGFAVGAGAIAGVVLFLLFLEVGWRSFVGYETTPETSLVGTFVALFFFSYGWMVFSKRRGSGLTIVWLCFASCTAVAGCYWFYVRVYDVLPEMPESSSKWPQYTVLLLAVGASVTALGFAIFLRPKNSKGLGDEQ